MARKKLSKEDIISDDTLTPQEKYHKYIKTDEWKSIRETVLTRDNNTCQCCARTQTDIDEYNTKKGKSLLSLVVHHTHYNGLLFQEVEQNYVGLITLCSACHRAIHSAPSNRSRFKFNE